MSNPLGRSHNQEVQFWDPDTGFAQLRLCDPTEVRTSLLFAASPTDGVFVAASRGKEVEIWSSVIFLIILQFCTMIVPSHHFCLFGLTPPHNNTAVIFIAVSIFRPRRQRYDERILVSQTLGAEGLLFV